MTKIVFTNMPQVLARLKTIRSKVANTAIPHKKISIMLDRWVQDNFKGEGKKVGGWKPIQRVGQILRKSGRLRASFIPFANKKDAGIGSDLPYSKKHEEGIGVAKRRILPVISEVKGDIVTEYEKHIERSAK